MIRYLRSIIEPSPSTARPFSDTLDWLLFVTTLIVGAGFYVYILNLGLTLHLVDQFSHLSMGRQITDSLTPGMSQVGFWPPLLHVLLAPLAAFDFLYYTGHAAPLLLVPVLGLGVVFLSRTIYLLTDNRLVSVLFALTLLLNPYVLYFAVTPMMEILFIVMLFGTAYAYAHWFLTGNITSLIMTGIFVSLATLARFEGFVLLPLVGLLILARLLALRRTRTEIEAVATIFGLIATTGIIFTLIYGFVYNDDPLAFMSNNWGAYAQQRDLDLPGEGSIWNATIYMSAAAKEMLGASPLAALIAGLAFLAVALVRTRALAGAIVLILVSPFLFDVLAVYQGSAIIYLPYLPPYLDGYFNVRYGLFLVGAVILVPALVAALFWRAFTVPRNTWPVHMLPAFYVFAFLVIGTLSFARGAGCADCFAIIRGSQQTSPADHAPAAETLRDSYDGGYILMTRALHNEVAVRAGIPLKHYILEANEHYYARAVEAPWWYARYVVMFNPSDDIHQPWQQENEEISRMWAGNEEFNRFYEKIFSSDAEAVYVLREPVLREYARTRALPQEIIPALQRETKKWDVEATHREIERALHAWRERETALGRDPEHVDALEL